LAPEDLPKTIGRYRVESELGRGMMGIVYKGREPRSGRPVALKVIRVAFAVSDEQRRMFELRFTEEARIVARLSHPGIVQLYEVTEDKKLRAPFMALEFLEGRTLSALLAEGPALSWRETLQVVARVAEALHYAHAQGVVHRDIKPANVMVLPSGQPKIMDFGLAKLMEAGLELTSTGQFLGTPLYMSPEQAMGERVDGRTDLFSLGSIAYTLITGKRAFEAEGVPQVLNRVAYQHPPKPTSLVKKLPASVDYLLARALAKAPADRHRDGQQMAEDIDDILAGHAPRHQAGWTPPDVGEGTLLSKRPTLGVSKDAPVLESLDLEPVEQSAPVRRRRGHGPVALLGLSMLALGAVLYSSAFWRTRVAEIVAPWLELAPSTADAPQQAPVAASLPVTAPPAPSVASPVDSSASPVPSPSALESPAVAVVVPDTTLAAAPTPTAAPSPVATPSPAVVPVVAVDDDDDDDPAPEAVVETAQTPRVTKPRPSARPSKVVPAPPPTSRLSIALEHGLRSGSVRVWVDDKLVLQQNLTSKVTRDLLVFKLRSGTMKDVLPVRPGFRRIRMEVRGDGRTRTSGISGTLKSGSTHRLQASLGRTGLSLSWH
jgi:serine/threonine protein kinase